MQHDGDRDLGAAIRAQIFEVADRLPVQVAQAVLIQYDLIDA